MNKLIALLFGIMSLNINAQDTTCVMITLDELIVFNYQTSEVIERSPHFDQISISVAADEVVCLHFNDEKRRFRDVITTWDDGDHMHDTFNTKDNVLYTPHGFGGMEIEISEPRKRK